MHRNFAFTLILLALAGCSGGEAEHASEAPRTLGVRVVVAREAPRGETSYRLTGMAEAARDTEAGFELAGLLAELMVDEGDTVAVGQALARLDTERLRARQAEVEAALAEAQSALDLANSTFQRTRDALDRKAVSAQALDEAKRQLRASEAAVAQREAQLRSIEVDLDKSTLRAPFDGTVAARYRDEGAVVGAGAPVLRLLERTRMEVRLGVSPASAARLGVGQSVPVFHGREPINGTVAAILPARSRQARTVDVLITLAQDSPTLRDGDLVEVELPRVIEEPGYWLPRTALTENQRGLWASYVVLRDDEGVARVQRKDVVILYEEAADVYVRGTLTEGDLVVADGLHRIAPDQRVEVVDRRDARTVAQN